MTGKLMLKLKQKGQASFEFLLVTLFILFVTLLVLNSWFSISDETQVIVLLKTKIVERLHQADDFYALRKIEVVDDQDQENLKLKVFITPSVVGTGIDTDIINFNVELQEKTKYDTVNIKVE